MEKDKSIESLRAIAIILVIGLHITNDAPMKSASDIYDYIGYMFQNIRMPLFTVISGYLYAARPVIPGHYLGFIKGKSHRILFPLFFVMTLEFLAATYAPGVNNRESISQIFSTYIFGYQHYWFLQAIFLILLVVATIGNFKSLGIFKNWLIASVIAIAFFTYHAFFSIEVKYFSFNQAVYLMPYFMLGMGLFNFGDILKETKANIVLVFLAITLIILQNYAWFTGHSHLFGTISLPGLATSIVCCSLIFRFRRPIWGLSLVGSFAFTIYLYQGFGVPIMRRITEYFFDLGPHTYFFSVIFGTLIFGIAVELALKKIPVVSVLFLGLKRKGPKHVPS